MLLLALGDGGEAHATGLVGSSGSHAAPGAGEGDLLGDATWSAAAARGGAPPLSLSPREAGTHSVAQAGAADTLLLLASLSGMRPAAYVLLGGFVVSAASLYLALSLRRYMEHPGGGAPSREWWWWRGVVAAAGLAGSVLHESSTRAMFALHLRLEAGSEGRVEQQWLLSEVRRIVFSIVHTLVHGALLGASVPSALHGPVEAPYTHLTHRAHPTHPSSGVAATLPRRQCHVRRERRAVLARVGSRTSSAHLDARRWAGVPPGARRAAPRANPATSANRASRTGTSPRPPRSHTRSRTCSARCPTCWGRCPISSTETCGALAHPRSQRSPPGASSLPSVTPRRSPTPRAPAPHPRWAKRYGGRGQTSWRGCASPSHLTLAATPTRRMHHLRTRQSHAASRAHAPHTPPHTAHARPLYRPLQHTPRCTAPLWVSRRVGVGKKRPRPSLKRATAPL